VFIEAYREMKTIFTYNKTFLLHCATTRVVGQSEAQLDNRPAPEEIMEERINPAKAPTSSNGLPDLANLI